MANDGLILFVGHLPIRNLIGGYLRTVTWQRCTQVLQLDAGTHAHSDLFSGQLQNPRQGVYAPGDIVNGSLLCPADLQEMSCPSGCECFACADLRFPGDLVLPVESHARRLVEVFYSRCLGSGPGELGLCFTVDVCSISLTIYMHSR